MDLWLKTVNQLVLLFALLLVAKGGNGTEVTGIVTWTISSAFGLTLLEDVCL